MSGRSYLDMAEEEQDAKEGPAGAGVDQSPAELDLSGLSPTPIKRPDRLHVAVEEGRRRGFGQPEDPPASSAPRRPSRAKAAAKASPAPKRVIVTLAERPPAGANGQVALTGDADVIYEFIRRAHFERRPRGELLADMMQLYAASRGPIPDDF